MLTRDLIDDGAALPTLEAQALRKNPTGQYSLLQNLKRDNVTAAPRSDNCPEIPSELSGMVLKHIGAIANVCVIHSLVSTVGCYMFAIAGAGLRRSFDEVQAVGRLGLSPGATLTIPNFWRISTALGACFGANANRPAEAGR